MQLSVIIVNYNVKFFLEQCINSVIRAGKNINIEIFVVDNNSADGSCSMLKKKFPNIHLIENKENKGFAKANNQAIKLAKGEYILLLNPDTLVEEETFKKCIEFMNNNKDAGGLGVKMINGEGKYLPESKRALPTPIVAFYKIFGLTRLFPASKYFGKYHLGYLDNNQTHEIEILAGAYMFLRREALDKSGLLDETFFMYGEDIDLSYRIIKAGYKNYYYPKTTIIHYKGESTKKGGLNYVLLFYNAMIIFSKKHFSNKNSTIFSLLIHIAIYFRIFLAICSRILNKTFLPIYDTISIYLGFILFGPLWEIYKFGETGSYPKEYFYYEVPVYVIIWIISIFFTRGYEKSNKISNCIKGVIYGSIVIIAIYSMLPESLRFSRALLIIGSLWSLISTSTIRFLLHIIGNKTFKLKRNKKKNALIIGNPAEYIQITKTLNFNNKNINISGFINSKKESHPESIGSMEQIEEIIRINNIDTIIFGSAELSSHNIIKNILKISEYKKIEYKISGNNGDFLIGTNSIDSANDFFSLNFNSIGNKQNIIRKRILDFSLALSLISFSPILMFFYNNPINFFKNIVHVFMGKKTFIGYFNSSTEFNNNLPKIKKGILYPSHIFLNKKIDIKTTEKINIQYAKNYRIKNDLHILFSQFRFLDR